MMENRKWVVLGLLAFVCLFWGCVPRLKTNKFLPDVIQVATPSGESGSESVVYDAQFVRAGDFFISEELAIKGGWVYVRIAKMLKAPDEDAKAMAEFQVAMDGRSVFSTHYVSTRIAKANELSEGLEVYFADLRDENGIYRAPESPEEALGKWWINSHIIEIQSQHVITADGMKIHKTALRVKDM